tara:strand:- start:408 stop:758 length:351 start_codon:yes stop_codon:yes gene_type:complete
MESFRDPSIFPVVRDDAAFWDGIEEYARQLRARERAGLEKRWVPPWSPSTSSSSQYCPICLKYKYAQKVDQELLLHLAQMPTHIEKMMLYDQDYNTTYFATVLHSLPPNPLSLSQK